MNPLEVSQQTHLTLTTSPVDADVAEVAATLERGALDITLGLEGSLLSLLLTPRM